MTLRLDRISLEDVGSEPGRMAAAILEQLKYRGGAVPIDAIAGALDIHEIRRKPLENLEGALLTTPLRDFGSILINSKASPQRQRFTIGHELGHFLIRSHAGTDAGFQCSRRDMGTWSTKSDERRKRQEAEANRFAIEILAPRRACLAFFDNNPDMAQILTMADAFDISRAAAARRFVELQGDVIAVVFSKEGRLIYAARSEEFPEIAPRKEDLLPLPPRTSGAGALCPIEDADATFWLTRPRTECELTIQTLFQKNEHAMSLLHLVTPEEESEPDLEDVFDRFRHFNDR